jgi:hypothetical protein
LKCLEGLFALRAFEGFERFQIYSQSYFYSVLSYVSYVPMWFIFV